MIDDQLETRNDGIHMRDQKLDTFNYFRFHTLFSLHLMFICSLAKATIAYLAPPEKSHQAKKKKKNILLKIYILIEAT